MYPAFTPYEIIAHAECIRLTPDGLFADEDLRGQLIGIIIYTKYISDM